MTRVTVVHLSGSVVEGVQRCVRCGEVLTDTRRRFDALTGAPFLCAWPVGAEVGMNKHGSAWVIAHDQLDAFDVAAHCAPIGVGGG